MFNIGDKVKAKGYISWQIATDDLCHITNIRSTIDCTGNHRFIYIIQKEEDERYNFECEENLIELVK